MLRTAPVSLLLLAASAAAPPLASACSCAAQTVEEAIAGSSAIFEGRVVTIESAGGEGMGALRVRLDVVQTWREANTEHVELTTSAGGASCGFPFEVGQSYLVYATESDGTIRASLCSRTRRIEDAEEDRATLGSGAIPVDIVDAPPESEARPRQELGPRGGGCAGCSAAGVPSSGAAAMGLTALLGWALARRRDR